MGNLCTCTDDPHSIKLVGPVFDASGNVSAVTVVLKFEHPPKLTDYEIQCLEEAGKSLGPEAYPSYTEKEITVTKIEKGIMFHVTEEDGGKKIEEYHYKEPRYIYLGGGTVFTENIKHQFETDHCSIIREILKGKKVTDTPPPESDGTNKTTFTNPEDPSSKIVGYWNLDEKNICRLKDGILYTQKNESYAVGIKCRKCRRGQTNLGKRYS